MALEDLIRLHTEALIQNTEAVKALSASLAGRTPAKTDETPAKVEKIKTAKAAAEPKKAKEEESPTSLAADADADTRDPADEPVPFITVRELVLKLSKEHRDSIVALNAKYKIERLGALLKDPKDPESEVMDQAKLEAIYADLLALEA